MYKYEILIKGVNGDIFLKNFNSSTESSAISMGRRFGVVISTKKLRRVFILKKQELDSKERQVFLTRLSGMLSGGVSGTKALGVIESTFTGNVKCVAKTVLLDLEAGETLVNSLCSLGDKVIPRTTKSVIMAGSSGGSTSVALDNAAKFEIELEEVKDASVRSLYEGIVGFSFAVFAVLVLQFFVVPYMFSLDFFKMYEDRLDLSTINALSMFTTVSLILLFTVFVLLLFLATVCRKVLPVRADLIIKRIPHFNSLVLAKSYYVSLFSLSKMIGYGLPMKDSIEMSGKNLSPGLLKDDFEHSLNLVKAGSPWFCAFRSFHKTDMETLGVSVDKYQISDTLISLSRQYKEDYKRSVSYFGPLMKVIAVVYLILASVLVFGYTVLPMLQISAQGA